MPGPHPVVQQRRRLEALLGDLGDDEWRHAQPLRRVDRAGRHHPPGQHEPLLGRCRSRQALAGEPTRFLASFDPVASPAQLVDSSRGTPPADTLAAFRAEQRRAARRDRGARRRRLGRRRRGAARARARSGWSPTTPSGTAGCTSATSSLPLGRPPVEDADEVLTCLRYAAGARPGLRGRAGRRRRAAPRCSRSPTPTRASSCSAAADQVRVHDGDAPAGRARSARLAAVAAARDAQPARRGPARCPTRSRGWPPGSPPCSTRTEVGRAGLAAVEDAVERRAASRRRCSASSKACRARGAGAVVGGELADRLARSPSRRRAGGCGPRRGGGSPRRRCCPPDRRRGPAARRRGWRGASTGSSRPGCGRRA